MQNVLKYTCSCKRKCMSGVHVNQIFMCALYANHDVHSSQVTSLVYTVLTSSILRAHTDNVTCIFRNILNDSSHVVTTCMYGQDTIELYCIYACNHPAIKKNRQLLKLLFIVNFISFTCCHLTHKITGN